MKSILATKFSSIYLAKGEKRLFFRQSFVNLQRAKDCTHVFDAKYRYVFAGVSSMEFHGTYCLLFNGTIGVINILSLKWDRTPWNLNCQILT